MNGTYTQAEREHVGRVKELPCSVCDEPGPSAAHHIEQGLHMCVVALCWGCHQGPLNGIHGKRNLWKVKHMSELDALNVTLKRLEARR